MKVRWWSWALAAILAIGAWACQRGGEEVDEEEPTEQTREENTDEASHDDAGAMDEMRS